MLSYLKTTAAMMAQIKKKIVIQYVNRFKITYEAF